MSTLNLNVPPSLSRSRASSCPSPRRPPPEPLNLATTTSSRPLSAHPPPYCSSPPLISLSSPTIPRTGVFGSDPSISTTTKTKEKEAEAKEEEEAYPHLLATPTQTSYFLELSGLFESQFNVELGKASNETLQVGKGQEGIKHFRPIEGDKFRSFSCGCCTIS